jgi:hypothetical protein
MNLRVRFAWLVPSVLGSLLAVTIVEAGAEALFAIRDALRPQDYRTEADAIAAAPWRIRYFQELAIAQRAEWRSYVHWRVRPFFGEFINVDANGLRHTWNPEACASREGGSREDVYFFGGSTVWGTGARDDYTLPSRLSAMLATGADPPLVCVTNFGQPGFVSSQELITLLMELRGGARPDVVVFYDGDNDAFAAFQEGVAGLAQNEDHRRAEFNLSRSPGELLRRSAMALLGRSALYRMADGLRARISGPRPAAGARRAEWAQLARSVVATYEWNVRLVEDLARLRGFRARFYWQPLVFDKPHRTAFELRVVAEHPEWGGEEFELFWKEVEAEVARSRALADDSNFRNLGDVFHDDPEPLFMDMAHLCERGNTIVADRISQDLRELPLAETAAPKQSEKTEKRG